MGGHVRRTMLSQRPLPSSNVYPLTHTIVLILLVVGPLRNHSTGVAAESGPPAHVHKNVRGPVLDSAQASPESGYEA